MPTSTIRATNTFTSGGRERRIRASITRARCCCRTRRCCWSAATRRAARYEQHIEIYSPAYLFNADGTPAVRPAITGVTPGAFGYGGDVPGADAGRGEHRVGRAGAARRADARVRHGSAAGRAVVHRRERRAERDGAAERQHRAARLLHAVRAELGGRAVGRELRAAVGRAAESGRRLRRSPARHERHRQSRPVGVFAGTRQRSGWHASPPMPGRSPAAIPASSSVANPGQRDLLDSRARYVASFTVTDNGGLTSPAATRTITVPDFSLSAVSGFANGLAGWRHELHRDGHCGRRIHRHGQLQRQRSAVGGNGSFNPASVTASGSTTLSVSRAVRHRRDSYPLTIAATSGPRHPHRQRDARRQRRLLDLCHACEPDSQPRGSGDLTVTIAAAPGSPAP